VNYSFNKRLKTFFIIDSLLISEICCFTTAGLKHSTKHPSKSFLYQNLGSLIFTHFSIIQALRISATPPRSLHHRKKIEIQKLILHCLLYNIPNRGYQMHGQSEPRWSGSAITPEAIKSWRDWGLHWSNHTVSSHQNEHTNIDLKHKKHTHLNSFSVVVTGYYHIHFSPFSISL